MKKLSYEVLKEQGYTGYLLQDAPERVLQFGEGNFLRAFVDYFFDIANEKCGFNGKIAVAQPIARGLSQQINDQQGLYTLYLRGFEDGREKNGKRVISALSRCLNPYDDFDALLQCAHNPDLRYIVSNTTEAGIVYDPACRFEDAPPSSFPAKLTRFLYERFTAFDGAAGKGFIILSCELIDDNGRKLRECVEQYTKQWNLPEAFARWVKDEGENLFCSTLVDRIVTGYPRAEAQALNDKNGYEDALLDTGEIFGFWVIEGPETLRDELPFARAGLPVLVTADHTPYKKRKVRILNGAHTSMVPAAYLAGQDIVRDAMKDPLIRAFFERAVYDEIIPTLTLPKDELRGFAHAVSERFQNPFIDHALLSIALNSISKWKTRVLPSLKGYVDTMGRVPPCLAFSLAALLEFYHGGTRTEQGMQARRGDQPYTVQDDAAALDFFLAHKDDGIPAYVHAALTEESFWGEDLTAIQGLEASVSASLDTIRREGMASALRRLLEAE